MPLQVDEIRTGAVYNVELKYTSGSRPYVSFSIGKTTKKFNQHTKQWEKGDPVFYPCLYWGTKFGLSPADFASLPKGWATVQLQYSPFKNKEGKVVPSFRAVEVVATGTYDNSHAATPRQETPAAQPAQPAQAATPSNDFDDDIPF